VKEAPRKGTPSNKTTTFFLKLLLIIVDKIPRIKTVNTFVASKIVERSNKKGCLVRVCLDY
jgi:hypothetical protein